MRALSSLVALALAGALAAQTNEFGIYPDATNSASRMNVPGASNGDACVQVDARCAYGCVGTIRDASGRQVYRVNGMRVFLQDQNCTSQEPFTLALIPDAGGAPDPTVDILRTGPLMAPVGPPSSCTFLVTVNFATPADVLTKSRTFYMAVGLPASPTWPRDGLSVHQALLFTGALRDNARVGAVNPAFGITRPANTVVQPSPLTARIYILTESGVLNVGSTVQPGSQRGPDPGYGVAGNYPDNMRAPLSDGFGYRHRDASLPGGFSVLFLGKSLGSFDLPFLNGCLCLDLNAGLYAIGMATVLDANGEASVHVLAPGQISPGILSKCIFQCIGIPADLSFPWKPTNYAIVNINS